MARIQGSSKRSPTRTTPPILPALPSPIGSSILLAPPAGTRSSLRLATTVVSACGRRAIEPMGSGLALAIGVGCAAYERAFGAGSPLSPTGHGGVPALVLDSAFVGRRADAGGVTGTRCSAVPCGTSTDSVFDVPCQKPRALITSLAL